MAPYGTNSSPRLYSGSYSRRSSGTTSRSAPSSFGRPSGTNGSARLAPSNSSRGAGSSRSISSRSARTNPGGSSLGARRNDGYRSAESYRNSLDSRLDRSGRSGEAGARRDAGGGAAAGRNGARSTEGTGGMQPRLRSGVDSDARRSPDSGLRVDGGGAVGRGDGYGRDRGHHHHHYKRGHSDFYFYLGGGGFGFGYYGGWGYYRSAYWDCNWYGWGYRSWYCAPYWYPRFYGCYYPYYWSYSWYPRYRTVYVYESREPYVSSGYLPAAAFDDDPYTDDVAPALVETTASRTTEAIVPIVADLDAGPDFATALAKGDAYLEAGESLKAAEAYRQAWIHDGSKDALARMAWALWNAGDHPLAAWAFVNFVGDSERRMLDAAVLLDDLFEGPRIRTNVQALERYLIDNPNDEGSNLLLGSIYVLTGREYAGMIVLTRLKEAGFEPATTGLMIKQARARLEG